MSRNIHIKLSDIKEINESNISNGRSKKNNDLENIESKTHLLSEKSRVKVNRGLERLLLRSGARSRYNKFDRDSVKEAWNKVAGQETPSL